MGTTCSEAICTYFRIVLPLHNACVHENDLESSRSTLSKDTAEIRGQERVSKMGHQFGSVAPPVPAGRGPVKTTTVFIVAAVCR